jgi:AcrR family transcriptional regulator
MGIRKEQKELTRKKLLAGAIQLFSQQGFGGTTTATLARAMELSHGTVFVHFPTREDLIVAVIDEFGGRLAERFRDCSAMEDLKEILEFHLSVLADIEDFYHYLISEIHQLPSTVRGQVFLLHAAISWKMYETAKVGMQTGSLKNMSRPLLFNTWIALVHYYVANRELLSDAKPILKTLKKELVDHFLNLIKIS